MVYGTIPCHAILRLTPYGNITCLIEKIIILHTSKQTTRWRAMVLGTTLWARRAAYVLGLT